MKDVLLYFVVLNSIVAVIALACLKKPADLYSTFCMIFLFDIFGCDTCCESL